MFIEPVTSTEMKFLAGSALLYAACGSVSSNPDAVSSGDAPAGDGAVIDAPGSARCDPAKPFGAAMPIQVLSSSNEEFSFAMTRDELTGFVGRAVQPPTPSATILMTHRASLTAPFSAPDASLTSAINGATGDEHNPSPVADGLILYFHRQVGATISVFAATRADASSAFSAGTEVTVDGSGLASALAPTISADGQTLYWLDYSDYGKVFAATRGSSPTAFVNKRSAATMAIGTSPVLSTDELTLYYASPDGASVLVSTRARKTDQFGTGVPLDDNVNSTANESPVALTADGCVLYISSDRPGGVGGYDLWEAHRPL